MRKRRSVDWVDQQQCAAAGDRGSCEVQLSREGSEEAQEHQRLLELGQGRAVLQIPQRPAQQVEGAHQVLAEVSALAEVARGALGNVYKYVYSLRFSSTIFH